MSMKHRGRNLLPPTRAADSFIEDEEQTGKKKEERTKRKKLGMDFQPNYGPSRRLLRHAGVIGGI